MCSSEIDKWDLHPVPGGEAGTLRAEVGYGGTGRCFSAVLNKMRLVAQGQPKDSSRTAQRQPRDSPGVRRARCEQ